MFSSCRYGITIILNQKCCLWRSSWDVQSPIAVQQGSRAWLFFWLLPNASHIPMQPQRGKKRGVHRDDSTYMKFLKCRKSWLSGQWNGKKTDNMREFSQLWETFCIVKWWLHKCTEYRGPHLQVQVHRHWELYHKGERGALGISWASFSVCNNSELRSQRQQ